jgi:uncharacterized membrane protein YphA (DoxX/SURF4 family)
MNIFTGLARVIVGVLFIFSGLIKANDPLGLSYKMQEFFEIWGWHALNDLTLAFSILMIAFEIIAGVAVLLGWNMRLFSWLLLLLTIFFTFLTGYALFSGKVKECGCFGDCIPLTAQQSFIKDIILLVLILLIFVRRFAIKPVFSGAVSIVLLLITTVFSFGFQWYVLKYLPVVDCLPYKAGKNIPEQMKVPPGAIPDSTVITFVYQKQGKEVEFTADKFPEDFNDSLYIFVKRYDKLVRKGNAEVPIKDFALTTRYGNDTTADILQTPGYTWLLFTKGFEAGDQAWLEDFKKIKTDAEARKIPLYFVTNSFDNVTSWVMKHKMETGTDILKCDYVAIKTAARANPTIYLLKQGTIEGKWSYAGFDEAYEKIKTAR